jgi:hypothetical protein
MKTWVEQFVTTGVTIENPDGRRSFAPKTMSESVARALVESPLFQDKLPLVQRIQSVPCPILMPNGDIRIPRKGYDKEFGIYLSTSAPELEMLDIDEARQILEKAHLGFPFKTDQDRTHAYARLLTPFFRGIIGFGEPVPCWFFNANRARCGKDYLAGVTQIVYEGFAFEDAALGDDPEETRKRITSGLLAGRRFFHFANCQGHINDKYFIQAITDMVWHDRLLGGNSAAHDLKIANQAEYSLSANVGLTCRSDLEPRFRAINQTFFEENENSRIFPVEDLHGWIRANRTRILCAIFTICENWEERGRPMGAPFTSFKRWGKIVGGAMIAAGLGDPTRPHSDKDILTLDRRTDAMRAVFEICYETRPDLWTPKKDLYSILAEHQDEDERLSWFGDFNSADKKRIVQNKFGTAIRHFKDRILSGIQLQIDEADSNIARQKIRFVKSSHAAPMLINP